VYIILKLCGDFFGQGNIEELERSLVGTAHEKRAVLAALKKADISKYIADIQEEKLAEVFF
jgi:lipoate-protein ligase A